MKKTIVPILITLLFSSASCQNTLTGLSGDQEQYVSADDISVSFGKKKYTLERGSYLTLKADVVTKNNDISRKVTYSVEQDGKIVSIEENDDGIILSGKNVGIVTIKAVCAANHDVMATTKVEVIKHIPALNKVWSNVNETTNYTLETIKEKEDSDTDYFPSSTVIVNEKAILLEANIYDEDTDLYYSCPLYYYGDQNNYIYGYGIDVNGYAFPIVVSANGDLMLQNSIAKSERGFLTKDNFMGFKDESISMNDVGLFYGLQSINPSWLAKSKAVNNEYEIAGDASDLESCYVKYLLWGLIDPVGRETYSNLHPEIQDIVSIISMVDLTIKAETTDTVSFTLSYDDDIFIDGDIETYTYRTSMVNIGTTDCSSIDGLDSLLDTVTASYPALNPALKLFEDGVLSHNYVCEREIYYQNPTTGSLIHTPFQIFYTENYMMAYFSKNLCDLIEDMGGDKMSPFGIGFLKKSDGIHLFKYDPTSSSAKITLEDVIADSVGYELWNVDFNLATKYKIPNYFTNSEYYTSRSLNALSDTPSVIFAGLQPFYYSHNETISNDFCDWYLGEEVQGDDFYHGINVKLKGNQRGIDSVSFLLAYEEDEYYHLLYTPTLSSFGEADSLNPADSYISEVLK